MPQAAEMVCNTHRRVATTAGYTIIFEPDIPVYVPALAVDACRAAGAQVVRKAARTEAFMPAVGTKGEITSTVDVFDDEESIEEMDLEEFDFSSEEEKPVSNRVFTESEERIRQGILAMLRDSRPEDWTNGGRPKLPALAKLVKGASVTGAARDRVWDKMETDGQIPDDYEHLIGLS